MRRDLESDFGLKLLLEALMDSKSAPDVKALEDADRQWLLDQFLANHREESALLAGLALARRRGQYPEICDAFIRRGLKGAAEAAQALVAARPPALPREAFQAHRGEWEEEVKRCGRDVEAATFLHHFRGDALERRLIVLRCQDGAMQRHFVARIAAEELSRVGRLAPPPTDWRLPTTAVRVDGRAAITGLAEAAFARALAESEAAYADFLNARPDAALRPFAPSLVLRAAISESAWTINPALTLHLIREVSRMANDWRAPEGRVVELRVFLLLVHDDTGVDPQDRLVPKLLWPFQRLRTRSFFYRARRTLESTGARVLSPWDKELGPGEREAVSSWAEANAELLGVDHARVLGDDIRHRVFGGYNRRRMSGVVNRLFEMRRDYRSSTGAQ